MLSGPTGALPTVRSLIFKRDAPPVASASQLFGAFHHDLVCVLRITRALEGVAILWWRDGRGSRGLSLLLRRRGPFMVIHLTLPNGADCRSASAPLGAGRSMSCAYLISDRLTRNPLSPAFTRRYEQRQWAEPCALCDVRGICSPPGTALCNIAIRRRAARRGGKAQAASGPFKLEASVRRRRG
jgi:hypothetical protein